MKVLSQLASTLNGMPDDVRMEVILMNLIQGGLNADEIEIVSSSLFKRRFHHDIEQVSVVYNRTSKREKLRVELNRDGLYDLLPENLFHQPPENATNRNFESELADIKFQQDKENECRLFFMPIEQEFYRLRLEVEAVERQYCFGSNTVAATSAFQQFWQFPDFFNPSKRAWMFLIMPVIHQIAGNTEFAAKIITIITGDKVTVQQVSAFDYSLPAEPVLGDIQLGVDSLLGGMTGSFQQENILFLEVSDVQQLADYMAGGRQERVLQFLIGLLFPFDRDVRFEPLLSLADQDFVLMEENTWDGRLNYSTRL